MELTLVLLPELMAVCLLEETPADGLPDAGETLWSLVITSQEISLVCPESQIPGQATRIEKGWRALQVAGPLDFSLVGVLANLSANLAQAGIPIFILSTYLTDYVLVKVPDLEKAISVLRQAGHAIVRPPAE